MTDFWRSQDTKNTTDNKYTETQLNLYKLYKWETLWNFIRLIK